MTSSLMKVSAIPSSTSDDSLVSRFCCYYLVSSGYFIRLKRRFTWTGLSSCYLSGLSGGYLVRFEFWLLVRLKGTWQRGGFSGVFAEIGSA